FPNYHMLCPHTLPRVALPRCTTTYACTFLEDEGMSIKTLTRIIGFILAIGIVVGLFFLDRSQFPQGISGVWWALGIGGGSALVAFIIAPYVTVIPYGWMRDTSASDLIAAIIGLIVGLIISVLLGIPLANLPANLGHILPFVAAGVFSFLGVALAVQRKTDMAHLFQT